MSDVASPVFRIDCFTVPEPARSEFLERVAATHQVLRQQDGFVFDRIVERPLGDGTNRMITIVEWADAGAIPGAVRAVRQAHAGDGFSAADFIAANGIVADIATYRPAS
ncbi:antibiotic biosynthesis monooxygenase family protein [Hoeflea sp.]|uniref:antibiotic biosynthesis monooxygenase family protein n=1 Tax=Hoeflea sp. TaxID=1940281 RepID=UPI003A8F4C80